LTVKIGDLVGWSWPLKTDWEQTHFTGIVVGSRLAKTDYDKFRVFSVLVSDGTTADVREDEASLAVISESACM